MSGRRTSQELIAEQISKPGRKGRINAKCIECIYDEYQPGTWRHQVEECTANDCPLWDVRPMTTPRKEPTGEPRPIWWQQKI